MEEKRNFWLTWPSIIVFIPFTLLILVFMLWNIFGSHPEAFYTIIPALKSWAITMLVLWAVIAAAMVSIFRLLDRQEEGDLNV